MIIPIGTEFRTQRPPVANWVLIALNVVIYLFTDLLGGAFGAELKTYFELDAAWPALHQYLTYQFLHGDIWHLLGNMLFLWIFGNGVCDRMGPVGYVFFYLAGGVCAGIAFTSVAQNPIVGASGAIAAVTTAFLALFPRVHVTMLVWMVFIFTFQVPAMIVIIFKIILWDNIIAPGINTGPSSNVAYSAHLGGYAFGFAAAMVLLATRAVPRNQFDMLALWDRWRRRTGIGPSRPVARPIRGRPIEVEDLGSKPLQRVARTPVEQLREEINLHMAERELEEAVERYERLLALDPNQVLSRPQQLELANYLAQSRRYRLAARAYEAYLSTYPGSGDAPQVLLFVGMIYGRYLADPQRAVAHLRKALEGLQVESQRKLAEEELRQAEAQITRPDATGGTGAST